jgi:hypothetical protein
MLRSSRGSAASHLRLLVGKGMGVVALERSLGGSAANVILQSLSQCLFFLSLARTALSGVSGATCLIWASVLVHQTEMRDPQTCKFLE